MGDLTMLAKARQELEELYMGVPDESVNLTFQDLPDLKQQNRIAERKRINIEIKERLSPTRSKCPNLVKNDRAFGGEEIQASIKQHHVAVEGVDMKASRGHRHIERDTYQAHTSPNSSRRNIGIKNTLESSLAYDGTSSVSLASRGPFEEGGGTSRPGIPHSNICTICNTYLYIFRHRCLVCGRVYCRQCVRVGMGKMTEGRKCVECLGRRFSQRYIRKAGVIGCCSKYQSLVKKQELKWAEKGPRRSGERGYNRNGMMSRSRSPVPEPRAHVSSSPPSFVMSSPYSAYSPTNQPIPF